VAGRAAARPASRPFDRPRGATSWYVLGVGVAGFRVVWRRVAAAGWRALKAFDVGLQGPHGVRAGRSKLGAARWATWAVRWGSVRLARGLGRRVTPGTCGPGCRSLHGAVPLCPLGFVLGGRCFLWARYPCTPQVRVRVELPAAPALRGEAPRAGGRRAPLAAPPRCPGAAL